MRIALLLLLTALLAGGLLLWLDSREDTTGGEDLILSLEEGRPDEPRGPADQDEPATTPTATAPTAHGVPRILPPDAAIEDVRDALALGDADARTAALAAAYGSIGRIAAGPRILAGLQRYAIALDDARVRGVVYAALGTNTSGPSHAWLARQLASGPALEDRLGALLGLAYDAKAPVAVVAALGGLPCRQDALPKRVDVREALPALLTALEGAAVRDALPVLEASLAEHGAWYAASREAIERLRAQVGD
ncbi:MAG: hypothetical protein P1V36_11465 [Planctomycetota bacterium]|nr:hypothetical protein [Planctomycetota bacterium]